MLDIPETSDEFAALGLAHGKALRESAAAAWLAGVEGVDAMLCEVVQRMARRFVAAEAPSELKLAYCDALAAATGVSVSVPLPTVH